MKVFQKKHLLALFLLITVVLLFYNSELLGRWLYPIHYKEDIKISALNHGLDPLLVAAVIRVETNYDPEKISPKGAIGLMQIMPDTAQWIVTKADYSPQTMDKLHRPDVNIELGVWYLNSLSNQFKGNMITVLGAYNAGPGNVSKWLQNETWDGTLKNIDQIPFGETRHYIQRVVYYHNKYISMYEEELE